uniref:Uncharacterized protein ycf56 n=1 Tax=Porphyra purpurea TaxID=2787 RepID=YCF56_PORPU|nr:hypothetical protein PopuCp023 [Porphyra purpurea]P51208.1 RecName: Full=Uncharacterized protein ycf56; AltName: Full=ORF263 [Porphyra purpurea]AAC08094.1 ORF263 [Porphyra purpurea]
MEIILFDNKINSRFNKVTSTNYAAKLDQTSEIWLFNCIENTQHIFLKSQLKLSQITKIFISGTSFKYAAGLPGLLSSLTLSGKINTVSIYGPNSLKAYLQACTKYSQTNFSFSVNFHAVSYGKLVSGQSYTVICLPLSSNKLLYGFTILKKQQQGVFNLKKAITLNISQGPIYGELKGKHNFLSPDGYYLHGEDFSSSTTLGNKISIPVVLKYSRIISEMHWLSSYTVKSNTYPHQQATKYLLSNIETNVMNYQVSQDNNLIE